MATYGFPFLRITMFGSGSCGKTTLIDAFVNNTAMLNSTAPTHAPTLYYKVCRLPEEEESASNSNSRSVCVEIEDTYEASRTDDQRDIRKYMTMKRKIMGVGRGIRDFTPFGVWKVPRTPIYPGDPYTPLTTGRMGMMIVFNVNDKTTLAKAMEIFDLIKGVLEYRQESLKPVIFLVGNKYDIDPSSERVQATIGEAEIFAQSKFIRFWKVSAISGKNVKKMFREMLYRILGSLTLWEIDYDEESSEEEETEGCGLM